MSNSPLATYTNISPNRTTNRNHVIDTLTIHCIVGQWTAKHGCDYFANAARQASANYVVGEDGSIGLCVPESERSWCTGGTATANGISGKSNDYQAITIEVASDTTAPYAVTDAAYNALLELCADICKRNPGIGRLKWLGDKSLVGNVSKQNMTAHRWFSNKACPGDYLYNRFGDIAAKVNAKLEGSGIQDPSSDVPYIVDITRTDLNIRKGPGTNYAVVGVIKPGVYTIVSEATGQGATLWGKLRSETGWISLDYVQKVTTNSATVSENATVSESEKEQDDMTYYKTINDVPAQYMDAVKKLVDKGALKGTGGGELNVSDDLCRTLTILNRLGKLD